MDEFLIVEREVEAADLIKRIHNKADRGPRKRGLINAQAKKEKILQERISRSEREKRQRAERLAQGICTRCGVGPAVKDHRMCDLCQRKGRKYVSDGYEAKVLRDQIRKDYIDEDD